MAGRGATETWAEPLGRGGDKKALRRRYLPPHQSCTMSRISRMYLPNKLTKIYATLVLMTHLLRVRGVCQYYYTWVAKRWQWIEKSSFDGVKSNFRVLPVYFCTFVIFCCIPQLCISPTTPPHLKGPLTHSVTLALNTYSLFSFEQLVPSCSFGFLWSWFDLYVSSSVISIESKIILCFWWGRDTAML